MQVSVVYRRLRPLTQRRHMPLTTPSASSSAGFCTVTLRAGVIVMRALQGKEIKPVSTSFFGVSPEFEMALYTLLFYMRLDVVRYADAASISSQTLRRPRCTLTTTGSRSSASSSTTAAAPRACTMHALQLPTFIAVGSIGSAYPVTD